MIKTSIIELSESFENAARELRQKQVNLENYAPELECFIVLRDALEAHPEFSGKLPDTFFTRGCDGF